MRPGDEEAVDDGSRDSNDFHCSSVFSLLYSLFIINQLSRLLYNEEHAEFIDIPSDALTVSHAEATCYSCDLKADESDLMKIHQPDDETLVYHGIEYHIHEFVYIHPSRNTNLLDIGQITAIEDDNVSVTFLARYDSFVRQQQKSENEHSVLVFDEVCNQFIFAI
jgi:DNA (cytosine-5)-methyltransferase 1